VYIFFPINSPKNKGDPLYSSTEIIRSGWGASNTYLAKPLCILLKRMNKLELYNDY
jgi:hypothetical protein